jgi:lipopolysaccharide transport system permease protein
MKRHRFDRHWFEFLWSLTIKEIKARYKKAILGFLWIFLNPLLQMMMIGLIFQFFVPVDVDNYYLFLFTGLLPWNFFSFSVTKNSTIIINERGLIKKSAFPRESIVLSVVLSNLFHSMIAWGLLVLLLIGDKIVSDQYSFVQLSEYIFKVLWTIPLLGWLTLLTTGLCLLFASLNVKYRDVSFMVHALMPLWFYATPIVYTLQILPENLSRLLYLNPMTGLTEMFHYSLLNQPVFDMRLVVADFFLTVLIFIIGCVVFAKEAPYFDDWI